MKHLVTFARLSGLWALAVAQPLLDTVARAPEFLVAHNADAGDVLLLVLVLAVLPPAAAAGLVAAAGVAGERVRLSAEALSAGVLAGVLAIQAGYQAGIAGWPATIIVAVLTCAAVALAWLRFAGLRTFATVLSAALVVVPAIFLASSGIRSLLGRTAIQVRDAEVDTSTPLVLVVFDELPLVSLLDSTGALDARRFPNLVRLAGDGVWFRNATASSDFTRWALPAILTGLRPRAEATPLFHEHPRNLFTLLGASHRIEALEPITALCPPRLCGDEKPQRQDRLAAILGDMSVLAAHVFLPPVERTGLPTLTANWAGFGDGADQGDPADDDLPLWRRIWNRRIDEDHGRSALRFVDAMSPEDPQPTLYFMHTLASHHPLRWLPSGQAVAQPRRMRGLDRDLWTGDPWLVTLGHQGHLIQAGLVDTIVGGIRTRFEAAGIYDKALIIVTSDHGVAFTPGDDLRSLTDGNVGEILPVPLIVKLPSHRRSPPPGTVDDRLVESIDLLPTIAEALGIELPWPVDGLSALGAKRRDAVEVFVRNSETVRRFDARTIEIRRAQALEQRRRRFTDAVWPTPVVMGAESLVGESTARLAPAAGRPPHRVHLDQPFALRRVRLDGASLPVQVAGRLEPAESATREGRMLALAVNGTIAAVTRTVAGDAGWTAVLPPDALREGANDLEVFQVESVEPVRVARLPQVSRDPRDVNLLQAGFSEWGVVQQGFYARERSGRRSFRWTNGNATIELPVPDGVQPRELRLDFASTGREARRVQVLADGCELFSGTVPRGASSQTIPLGRCAPQDGRLRLRILSDTHQTGADARRLGVALSRVQLN